MAWTSSQTAIRNNTLAYNDPYKRLEYLNSLHPSQGVKRRRGAAYKTYSKLLRETEATIYYIEKNAIMQNINSMSASEKLTYLDGKKPESLKMSESEYRNLWNKTIPEYNAEIKKAQEDYEQSIITARALSSKNGDNTNYNKPWLAGGINRNSYYSPTTHAPIDNQAKALDFGGLLMLGSFDFLNPAHQSVNYLATGGLIDMLMDYNENKTESYEYTISITDMNTQAEISYITGSKFLSSNFLQERSNENDDNGDVESLSNIFNNMFTINVSTPIALSFSIVHALTGDEMTFKETFAAGVLGTVMSGVANVISQSVANFVGVVSVYGAVAVSAVVGTVLSELTQMALGIDNHFGFGGDLIGFDNNGTAQYADQKSIEQGIRDMTPDWMKSAFGMETTFGDLHTDLESSIYTSFTTGKNAHNMDVTQSVYTDPWSMDHLQFSQKVNGVNLSTQRKLNNHMSNDSATYRKAISIARKSFKSRGGSFASRKAKSFGRNKDGSLNRRGASHGLGASRSHGVA